MAKKAKVKCPNCGQPLEKVYREESSAEEYFYNQETNTLSNVKSYGGGDPGPWYCSNCDVEIDQFVLNLNAEFT